VIGSWSFLAKSSSSCSMVKIRFMPTFYVRNLGSDRRRDIAMSLSILKIN
jgi:hypothetical protein